MGDASIKVLFVSADPGVVEAVDPLLGDAPDIDITAVAESAADALSLSTQHTPDAVVMDSHLPEVEVEALARALLQDHPDLQIIMLMAERDPDSIRLAMRAGARDALTLPLHEGELVETLRWLVAQRRDYARMEAFMRRLRRAYEALFSDDKPVPPRVVTFLERQAAQNPTDVLTQETLAVAYARNRNWRKLAPLAAWLVKHAE
jgi:DNA-binding NarL/FixJ family response regulator